MTDIEKSTGNVYADLDSPDAAEMQIKARLASKISDIIQQRQLTQQEAAEILGITQPKLSGLLRGQFRGISESKMLDCLNRLGRDIEIVVKRASQTKLSGTTRVVFS